MKIQAKNKNLTTVFGLMKIWVNYGSSYAKIYQHCLLEGSKALNSTRSVIRLFTIICKLLSGTGYHDANQSENGILLWKWGANQSENGI